MTINEQASAVLNNVVTGLRGLDNNLNLSIEQIEDAIIAERAKVIKEYVLQGVIDIRAIAQTIPCVPVELSDTKACCILSNGSIAGKFYIPKVLYGEDSVLYIGTDDRLNPFKLYMDRKHNTNKYRRNLSAVKPYVWIDNIQTNSKYVAAYLFNAPTVQSVTISAIFDDPRDAGALMCDSKGPDGLVCKYEEYQDHPMIANDTMHRVTEKYMRYYRTIAPQPNINDQTIKP